jgi:dephospho-CoA kinase
MIIGLTGKYCAGKNHIAAILEARGLPVLDVDKLGYQVLETEKEAIFTRFGSDLKKPDGSLDRRLLGRRVFGNPEKLAALEAIVHPPVNRLTDEWIKAKETENKACVINAALLHKSTAFGRLDRIILVTAPFLTRFFRARRRDSLSYRAILSRFASQKDFNSQYLSINAEIYRVENPGFSNPKKLESRLDKFIEGIR